MLRNRQRTGLANFGHDLALCDWNNDGNDDGNNDLCVGAIWNTNSQGVEAGGRPTNPSHGNPADC